MLFHDEIHLNQLVLKAFRLVLFLCSFLGLFAPIWMGIAWAVALFLLAYFLPEIQHYLIQTKAIGPWDDHAERKP